MTDEDSLWKHLELNPTDDTAKLALADLLTESGDEDTAYALKWCVEKEKWPARGPEVWFYSPEYEYSYPLQQRFPACVYNELYGRRFLSIEAAILLLGATLTFLQYTISIETI